MQSAAVATFSQGIFRDVSAHKCQSGPQIFRNVCMKSLYTNGIATDNHGNIPMSLHLDRPPAFDAGSRPQRGRSVPPCGILRQGNFAHEYRFPHQFLFGGLGGLITGVSGNGGSVGGLCCIRVSLEGDFFG